MRAALVIAHPGHELCIYGWFKSARPRVFVLTDGSGHSGKSRIERTTNTLKELGAEPGSFYGRFSDAAIYEALLNHRFDLFIRLAKELAAQIMNERIECVVADACEGYNPAHDVCRLVVDVAVEIVRTSGRKVDNLLFLAANKPDTRLHTHRTQPICLRLDRATYEQKLAAAQNYPELKSEIDDFINAYSIESLRSEYLYRADDYDAEAIPSESLAYYEQHGEMRVKQGYYSQVIRYREHVLPLALALNCSLKETVHEQTACADYDL
jgi:hypothetical protein